MINWIITGGAGSGKSVFSSLISESTKRLIATYSCDEATRQFWQNINVKNELKVEFAGEMVKHGIVDLNPGTMRRFVFGDSAARKRLEAIMHPRILGALEETMSWSQKQGESKVFLAEVPLYYEARLSIPADTVIVVAASRTVQCTRLVEHRILDVDIVEGMLNAQLPLELKINKADVIVWNDGSPVMLEAQAQLLLRDRW